MSTLPDIQTDETGLCAFWNAINQSTEDSIDPSEVTSDSDIASYTLYDNGIEGEYNMANPGGYNCHFRVKTDGWIVTYFDDEGDDKLGAATPDVHGQFDIVHNWANGGQWSYPEHELERIINSLASELSNWATIQNYYNSADVGLHSFDYQAATGVTILTEYDGDNTSSGEDTGTVEFTATPGTDVHYAVASGILNSGSTGTAYYRFEGNDVCTDETTPGARDILSLVGGSIDPGTTYSGSYAGEYDADFSMNAVLIWS
jgi:hypothetical protein